MGFEIVLSFGGCVRGVTQSAAMQRMTFSAASILFGCHSCNACVTQQGVQQTTVLLCFVTAECASGVTDCYHWKHWSAGVTDCYHGNIISLS